LGNPVQKNGFEEPYVNVKGPTPYLPDPRKCHLYAETVDEMDNMGINDLRNY